MEVTSRTQWHHPEANVVKLVWGLLRVTRDGHWK